MLLQRACISLIMTEVHYGRRLHHHLIAAMRPHARKRGGAKALARAPPLKPGEMQLDTPEWMNERPEYQRHWLDRLRPYWEEPGVWLGWRP